MPDVFKELAQAQPELVTGPVLTGISSPTSRGGGAILMSQGPIRYLSASVTRMELVKAPVGLKTLVNCFHHMTPIRRAISCVGCSKSPAAAHL